MVYSKDKKGLSLSSLDPIFHISYKTLVYFDISCAILVAKFGY